MAETTSEFLSWLANRLVNVYHESPDAEFVQRLRGVGEWNPHPEQINHGMGFTAPCLGAAGQRRPINRPCSACGDGDTEMRDHLHYPPFADEAALPEPSCTLCGAGMILVYKCRSCGATSDLNEIPSGISTAVTGAATDSAGQSDTRVPPADQSSGAGPQDHVRGSEKVISKYGQDGKSESDDDFDNILERIELGTHELLDKYGVPNSQHGFDTYDGLHVRLEWVLQDRSDLRDANRRLADSLEKAQAELSCLRKG